LEIKIISWDRDMFDHISRHEVSPEEAEEVLFDEENPPLVLKGREGKYLAYGQTGGGRYLMIVWVVTYRKTKIITAREMTTKEKQFFKRSQK
jgi:uncharacterized DUF497 family protein